MYQYPGPMAGRKQRAFRRTLQRLTLDMLTIYHPDKAWTDFITCLT